MAVVVVFFVGVVDDDGVGVAMDGEAAEAKTAVLSRNSITNSNDESSQKSNSTKGNSNPKSETAAVEKAAARGTATASIKRE